MKTISYLLLATVLLGAGSSLTAVVSAAPNYTINYQGKITNTTGIAVTNGSYNMEFNLYTQESGGVAIWTETLTGSDQVTVQNGLFSVMLGSTTPLTGIDFNQTLYLGVNFNGDGEMSPRKVLGTVPSAFESRRLGGVASSSFLRSDQDDTASGLLSFTGGLLATASSTITDLTTTIATTTTLVINGEAFTNLTGTGLTNVGGILSVATSTLEIGPESLLATDFGDFSCNGTSCALDTGVVSDNEIDYTNVTLNDLTFDVNNVSKTEFGYLDGVTSSIQTQLDGKLSNTLQNGYVLRGSAANFAEATSSLFIADNGFIGIGTTTPAVALEVVGAQNITSSAGNALNIKSNSSVTYFNIDNTNTGLSAIRLLDGGSSRWIFGSNANNSDAFQISASSAFGTSDYFTINRSTGNVGIGTTTPNSTLTVAGSVQFASTTGGFLLADSNGIISASSTLASSYIEDAFVRNNGDTMTGTLILPNAGLQVGSSVPFSDSFGILALTNVDSLDTTTESTIESAIDTLNNLTSASSLATVGTITSGTWQGTDIDISSYTNLGVTATGLLLSGDNIALDGNYTIPLTASTTEWATAFGWGDHSTEGYLTSVSPSDLSLQNGYVLRGSAANFAEATSSLFIADNGFIGIGTTTPASRLDVWGSFRVGTSSNPALPTLYVESGLQNVGIGTASPNGAYKLHVYGSGNVRALIESSSGSDAVLSIESGVTGTIGYDASSNTTLQIINNSQEAINITSTGLVGIGSTTPTSKLDVWGDFRVGTSSIPALFTDVSNGFVGIGTNSPSDVFHIVGAEGDLIFRDIDAAGGNSNSDMGLVFEGQGNGLRSGMLTEVGGQILSYGINKGQLGGTSSSYAGGIFRFDVRGSASPYSNQFVIKRDPAGGSDSDISTFAIDLDDGTAYLEGDVGIGTTNPARRLDVTSSAASGEILGLRIGQGISGTNYTQSSLATGIEFVLPNNVDLTQAAKIVAGKDTADWTGGTSRDSNLQFYTRLDNTINERLRITSTGNVGIGTTTPASALDVWGSFRAGTSSTPTLIVDTSSGYVGIGVLSPQLALDFGNSTGFYRNGNNLVARVGGSDKFAINTGSKAGLTNVGVFTFSNNGSATNADTGISRYSANILAVGNGAQGDYSGTVLASTLGIGTTTPAFDLTVAGDVHFTGAMYDALGLAGGSGDCLTSTVSGTAWSTCSGGSSPLTTKGDLYTYSTGDARLPVGSDGQYLVASSTTSTGLAWTSVGLGNMEYFAASKNGDHSYTTNVWAPLQGWTEDNADGPYTFNSTTGVLTFNDTALYQVIVEVYGDGATNRVELNVMVAEDTGAGFASTTALHWRDYVARDSSAQEDGGVTGSYVKEYTAGDDIRIEVMSGLDGGAFTTGTDDARLYVVKLQGPKGDTGNGIGIGSSITSATEGSVLFAGAAGVLTQDNSNFFWDDTANSLGIGTNTPNDKLEVLSTSDAQLRLSYDTSNYHSLQVASDGGLTWGAFGTDADLNFNFSGATDGDFSVNSDDLFVDTSTGRVGIGMTNPSRSLEVQGPVEIRSDGGNNLILSDVSGVDKWFAYIAGNDLRFWDTSDKITFQAGGNVGIGTTTPASRLDVWGDFRVGTSSTPALFADVSSGYVGIGTTTPSDALTIAGGGLYFGDGGYPTISSYRGLTIDPGYNSSMQFSHNLAVTVNDSFTLSDFGSGVKFHFDTTNTELGIGTSNPSTALDVVGTASSTNLRVENTVTFAGITGSTQCLHVDTNGVVSGTGSDCGSGGGMSIGGSITSATQGSVLFAGASGVLAQDNANFFWDDSTNRLGIGTTSPASTLDVWGDLRVGTSSNPLVFANSATGQIGIGTTNPLARLYIQDADNNSTADILQLLANNLSQGISFGYNTIASIGSNPTVDLNIISKGGGDVNLIPGNGSGNVGIFSSLPDGKLEVNLRTSDFFRLTYNDSDGSAANYTDFTLASDGALTIAPSNSATTTIANGLVIGGNLTISGITGSTQCLHVDTNGVVSGTGSDCGSGGGVDENTVESYIFDSDAEDISGVWEVQDDVDFVFGNDANWAIQYDEGVDNQLLFVTTGTAATAITDPLYEILVGTTPTANQQVFGVAKGTQSSNTELFSVDEDGDGVFAGSLTTGTLSVATTLSFSGVGALNGVDSIDATTEATIEAQVFDADAKNLTGIWEVQDDVDFRFGNDANWSIQYDEGVDDQLLFVTTGTAAIAITDPMFEILVGTTPTANQQIFGVAKGSQSSNTELFSVDEDGDGVFAGTLSTTGGLVVDATSESNIESAIDTLTNLTAASSLATVGTITSGTWNASFSNNVVTPNSVRTTGLTDEYCLTYEATGTTWEWQACGGAGGLLSTDIDTSAELLAIVTDETGSGALVFGTQPTFTTYANFGTAGVRISDDGDGAITFLGLGNGFDEDLTLNLDDTSNTGVFTSSTGLSQLTFTSIGLSATAGTFSSTLTLSGSAANIALGSNWLSGDGADEGIFVDSSGNVGIGSSNPSGEGAFVSVRKDQNAETILKIWNGTSGASATARLDLVAATANAYVIHAAQDNNASPYYISAAGPGILNSYYRMPNFNFQNIAGSNLLTVNASGDGAFTGTVAATAATFSSTLTLSGSAANIALGSNYLSGDGADEGLSIDSSGNGLMPDDNLAVCTGGSCASTPNGTGNITAEGAIVSEEYTLGTSGSITINWDQGTQQRVNSSTGNMTFNFSNATAGQTLRLVVCFGGAHTITWTPTIRWAGGSAPTPTSTNTKCDVFSFLYTGTAYFGQPSLNF